MRTTAGYTAKHHTDPTRTDHSVSCTCSPWLAAAVIPLGLAPVAWGLQNRLELSLPLYSWTGLLLMLSVGVITYTDIRSYRIPNWVTYPAFCWGLAINALASTPLGQPYAAALGAVGLGQALLGAVVLFVVMLIVLSFTGGGAGDVKLAAAIGALLGLGRGVDAVAYAMALAGVGMIVIGLFRYGPLRLLDSAVRPIAWRLLPVWIDAPQEEHYRLIRCPVPLGPFFAAGVVVVLLDLGPGMQSLMSY